MSSALNGKVDKVDGKGLSTNDYDNTEKGKVADNTTARHTHSNKSVLDSTTASYTTDEKTKLSGIESGAEANIIETVKVNGTALIPSSKAVDVTVPTKVSDLTNDSGYTTNIGTITGITMNSESKGTSGTVDLGTVITAHQDITGKEDKSNKVTSMTSSSTDTQYPSAKAVYDELEDLKEENSELKQRIEDEENNQLTNTASGTNLNINDTASYPIREIQVKGNIVQDETPTPTNPVEIESAGDAKNLYYLPEAGSSNGITYSINEDGTINLSGTATANVTFPIFKTIAESNIKNGSTYTFSSNQALPSGVEFRVEAFNDTSWLRHLIGSVLNSSYQVFTGTANLTNATRIRHLIYIASGTTVNITNLGIQFEKGDTQTSFTPEGKGFINEIICNKNLFDKNNPKILNAFVNGNTGLLTAPTNNQKSIAVRLQANTTYTISGVERASSNYGLFDDITLTIDTSVATQKGNISNGKMAFITGNNTKWLVFLLGGGTETYGYNNVQIEVGSTETSFIQHQEQSFTIPCQQPMRSIGDIKDVFVKENGVWYEKHNLRQRILNGNENWISQTQTGFYRYGLADSVINNETSYASQIIIKSDSFKGITFNNRNSDTNETIYAVSNGQQHNLFINTKSYTTLDDFKNWLTGNNIEVLYLLNEPNYIQCTQEQVTALEAIEKARTYKKTTNVFSEDITPAYITITYVRDLESAILSYIDASVNQAIGGAY